VQRIAGSCRRDDSLGRRGLCFTHRRQAAFADPGLPAVRLEGAAALATATAMVRALTVNI